MKRLSALALGACLLFGSAPWALAACTVTSGSSITSPFTTSTRLDTYTADAVKLTGGCIDGIPIGQNVPAAGSFTNLNVSGTITGTYTLGGTGNLNFSQTTDHSAAGVSADTRLNNSTTTLSPSVNTTNIWENVYSAVILNGPGQANGEINLLHPYFQNNVGGFAAQVETLETSALNSGTITNFNNGLHLFNNAATGTVTGTLYGSKFQLTNSNSTAGAIANYAAIDMEAMAGAGSAPTFYYLIRNADSNAYLSTNGNVNIGTISPQNNRLYVQGTDTVGTFAFVVKNSTPSFVFALANNGNTTIGLSGGSSVMTVNGTIATPNTTTGTPVASLCLDGSNNIIKKTTTGACI